LSIFKFYNAKAAELQLEQENQKKVSSRNKCEKEKMPANITAE